MDADKESGDDYPGARIHYVGKYQSCMFWWMLTKKAATIIQHKVRCWLEQQEASGSFAGGAAGDNVHSGGSLRVRVQLIGHL